METFRKKKVALGVYCHGVIQSGHGHVNIVCFIDHFCHVNTSSTPYAISLSLQALKNKKSIEEAGGKRRLYLCMNRTALCIHADACMCVGTAAVCVCVGR